MAIETAGPHLGRLLINHAVPMRITTTMRYRPSTMVYASCLLLHGARLTRKERRLSSKVVQLDKLGRECPMRSEQAQEEPHARARTVDTPARG